MVVVKCCSGCGVVKSLDDYYRDRAAADGRRSDCKECVKARQRRYREANRDKVLESRRWYYEENRDKELEYRRLYYKENLEYANRQTSRYVNRCQSVTESAATKRGPWSEAEIAILMADDGRTLVSKALEIGRTYKSCVTKRERLRSTGAAN